MASNEARVNVNYNERGILDPTTSNAELTKVVKKKQEERAAMMEGVDTQKEVFSKEVTMDDLTGGKIMKNKIQGIADSYKRFSEMLRETAANRNIDTTSEENDHMFVDAIPSSMAATHNFYRANGSRRLNGRK